ncbi:MAG: WYL domain-containing protein [Clostridiales bacterium]|nr:WYL domain-containing protein [Clostridiales bacterium]
MENIAAFKSDRLLQIYSRLVNGEILSKQGLAQEFGVTERSIQRDIGSLRCFITEQGLSQEILYDRNGKGYFLKDQKQKTLTNSEILAVCKILLESRSMNREEMIPILDKLLDCCVPSESKKAVSKLIANERHHYIPPQHGRNILPGLWEIGQAIGQHHVMEMEYRGLNGKLSVRTLEPVGLMFSEYYFYLVGFLRDIDRKAHFENPDDLFPTIYRIDRIQRFKVTDEVFTPAYATRFQEGEFRKRIQFMFGGKLNQIRFKYTGPSIEAVLDRLPTAVITGQDEEGWFIEAEVFGKGVDMWLRSQGEQVSILSQNL